MTNREFRQQSSIFEKRYYYWLRKLRKQAVAAVEPQLVPLEPVTVPENSLRIEFRRVQMVLSDRARHRSSCSSTSLPAIPMIDLSKVCNYYVAFGHADLRCGIDGLAAVVTQQYGENLDEECPVLHFCIANRMRPL